MVDVHLVQPSQLPESYKKRMERLGSAKPQRQAEETCSLLEKLALEHAGEQFFCMSKTILQYLNEPAMEYLKENAKTELDTRAEELPEDLRWLYRILEPAKKNSPNNLVERLMPMLIENFIDRKYPGRIDVVVDIDNEQYYLVPKELEHKDFIPTIPHQLDKSMIPFYLRLEKDEGRYHIKELVLGASSFEATFNVKHSYKDLAKARQLAWRLIINSPVLSNDRIERDEILRDYAMP